MMTNPTEKFSRKALKTCKVLFGATIVSCLLWCLWFSVQIYNQLFTPGVTEWVSGFEGLQKTIMILYWSIPLVYLMISVAFFCNLLKGLSSGIIFNPRCVRYLYALAVVYFISDIVIANIYNWGVMANFSEIVLNPSFLTVPIIIFAFAALFQLACKVSEDSALTI